MACEIHQDDIGTRFQITIRECNGTDTIDVSTALYRQLTFRKPSDTLVTRTASIFNDGSATSGVIYYDSVAGDLDEVGNYKLQAKISFASGTYYTDIYTFKVHCNL
jgi:hypothetical protein